MWTHSSLLRRDDDLLHSLIVFLFTPNESDVPIKVDRFIFLNVFEKIQTYTVLSQFPAVNSSVVVQVSSGIYRKYSVKSVNVNPVLP